MIPRARVLVLLLATPGLVFCQGKLADASLEQLLEMQVTSVSKKEQKLSRSAAAIFVITQEEIRRSGANTIPDVLRLAPGVDVAQIDANSWAISIRGFASRYADKVLVLIDGRSVYTNTFSGVYWEQIDLPLETIERIEVIRGPGATLWGANAVNGVINIITRNSHDTQKGVATAAAGSHVGADAFVRYGGMAGRNAAYRVFGRFLDVGSTPALSGASAADHWTRAQGGFRTDWDASARDRIAIEGDFFFNQQGQSTLASYIPNASNPFSVRRYPVWGGSIAGQWSRTLRGGSELSFHTYFEGYRRNEMDASEEQREFDFTIEHHVALGSRHDVVWGAGHRRSVAGATTGATFALDPPSRSDNLYSGFFQDEFQVARLAWLTYGCKLEHNAYTGFEYEPNLRLAWTPSPYVTVWAAASRAVREPARQDTSITVQMGTITSDPAVVESIVLRGNPHLATEEVRDFELGYRTQISRNVSLDVATFLSAYRRLTTIEPGLPEFDFRSFPIRITIPMVYANMASALNYGGEAALNWSPVSSWRISPSYSLLRQNLRLDPSSHDVLLTAILMENPAHLFRVASFWDISPKLRFDQSLGWTAALPGTDIKGHARLDARLARRIGESAEISIVGQNLLRRATPEFLDRTVLLSTQALRGVYGKIAWTF